MKNVSDYLRETLLIKKSLVNTLSKNNVKSDIAESFSDIIKKVDELNTTCFYTDKLNVTIKAKGYLSIILQHEIDHLDGKIYTDRIDPKDPFKIVEDAILI